MGVKVREKPKNSGNWWVFIDHQGRRKAKKIGKDKRTAMAVAKQIEAKLALGEFGFVKKETELPPLFKEFAQYWCSYTLPATCKFSTQLDYKSILDNHVAPAFGEIPVRDITRKSIRSFLIEKSQAGYALSTVSHMKSCLAGVLEIAIDDEVISQNPAHRIGKYQNSSNGLSEINDGIKFLNKAELSTLMSVFRKHFAQHYPLALLLARTGMRIGEAFALKWEDVDFEKRIATVRRTFSRGRLGTPKNGKKREVDMSLQLTGVLKDLHHRKKLEALKNGSGKIADWVSSNDGGNALDINNWRKRVFYKALKKAKLPQIRVHDLRHTYASLLIQAGESLAYVRDQLGHYSIKVTVDTYGHLVPGGNKDAVDRLDDLDDPATIRNLSATNKKGATVE